MYKKKFLVIGCLLFGYLLSFSQSKMERPYPVDTTYQINIEYIKNKKHYPYIMPVKDETPIGVKDFRNVVYTTLEKTKFGKRELHLDIFSPKKKGKYPVVLLIHGGGWRAGDKSLQVPLAQLISKRGFVTVTVEYQLGLEAQYPAAVYNIKAAVRWLRANADKYQINPEEIAVSGSSAGGHLASLIGLTNGVDRFEGDMGNAEFSSSVQAIIDVDGVINFMAPTSLNLNRRVDSPDVQWLGGTFTEIPEIWKEASPIYWANENSVPIMFLNSGYPRFHSGQDELIGMLKQWGIYHEVHKFNVKMHTFWLFHPFVDETADYMIDFMNKVF